MPRDVGGFAALGVTIQARAESEEVFELWDINADVLELFLAVQSQWRCVAVASSIGGAILWLGLDYAGVDAFMRRSHSDDEDGELFAGLQVMEGAALAAFSEVSR